MYYTSSMDGHVMVATRPYSSLDYWVPEGSLAGFFWGAFLRSGQPREPGNAFQNVGGFALHILEGLSRVPGAGQTS